MKDEEVEASLRKDYSRSRGGIGCPTQNERSLRERRDSRSRASRRQCTTPWRIVGSSPGRRTRQGSGSGELEAILAESDAGASGAALGERLERLERENEGLRQSVAKGREAVEELLSRLGPG